MRQTVSIIIKTIIILVLVGYLMLLYGCAKSASETATEAALGQVAATEQQIKKECPQAKIDDNIKALKATIQSQLASCNAEKAVLEQKNTTLLVILASILIILGITNWAKIKRII